MTNPAHALGLEPLSHAGLNLHCAKCMARPGQPCRSGSGRTLPLTHTHAVRWRADVHSKPVRKWFAARTNWRSA